MSLVDRLQKLTLYETKTRFFFIGSDPCEKEHRILKIDRTVYKTLSVTEDDVVYTKNQIQEFLKMMDDGNKSSGGLRKVTTLFGIVGFVHFLEGYYAYIITKASQIAVIGGHYVYKIDETQLVSIPQPNKVERHADEARYIDVFSNVDLTRNFYFSYSYDLTHTLQYNMTRGNKNAEFNDMFIWNHYLLSLGFKAISKVSPWTLPIVHGFLAQSKLSVAGRTIFMTLLGRRSRHFAGARFLKRGVNDQGYVANDVETEQIVYDATSQSMNYTSFVQHRGSIPLFWSQETSNMSPKPPIQINLMDPFYSATALHFENMFKRYSYPIIILNLVKQKENTKRESILLEEYTNAIKYLNQFLPNDKKLQYLAYDMSRAAKAADQDVIMVLERLAEETMRKTKFFHSKREPFNVNKPNYRDHFQLQSGVVRTNCIDCLDRTNAAQFFVGKCALAHQLYALGLLEEPELSMDCYATKLLMQMFHDHGDIIALQYGGSALVNTVETYRKTKQWQSQSRDMIETIKRYYSNSFTDAEKQDAINLFLGNFVSHKDRPTIWELSTDYYLHHEDPREKKSFRSYKNWFDPAIFDEHKMEGQPEMQFDFNNFYETFRFTSLHQHFLIGGIEQEEPENRDDPLYSPFRPSAEIAEVERPSRKNTNASDTEPVSKPNNKAQTSATGNKYKLNTADLCEKLLSPTISQEEHMEYERYVNQFKSDKMTENLEQYNLSFYEDYVNSFKNLSVSNKDMLIYEKYTDYKNQRQNPRVYEGYRRWLETGKYSV